MREFLLSSIISKDRENSESNILHLLPNHSDVINYHFEVDNSSYLDFPVANGWHHTDTTQWRDSELFKLIRTSISKLTFQILSESLIAYKNCTTVLMQLIFNPATNTTRTVTESDKDGCVSSLIS